MAKTSCLIKVLTILGHSGKLKARLVQKIRREGKRRRRRKKKKTGEEKGALSLSGGLGKKIL